MVVQQVDAARAAGLARERDSTPVLPTVDVSAVVDRRATRVAGPASQPRGNVTMAAAWEHLEAATDALRKAVGAADGLALGEVHAPHPALGPLNLYQWLIFIGAHEARHADQIREIGTAQD
jgi:hypothetical protein